MDGQNWGLPGSLILGSGIGIYYYPGVVYYMTRRPEHQPIRPGTAGGWREYALPCALIAIILLLGTLPQSLMASLEAIL